MTKQLEAVAASIRSRAGCRSSRSRPWRPSSLEARVAYNLIVADFSTYFVAERGLLVHDNTPRKPTAALLPGPSCRRSRAVGITAK